MCDSKTKIINSTMTLDKMIRLIDDYANLTEKENSRYKSWIYCYKRFSEYLYSDSEKVLDYLAINLAFYLASWGMYRGSSFLLMKDYKIHIPVIKILQEEKYKTLKSISAEKLCIEANLNLLFELGDRIKKYYRETPAEKGKKNNATDTLITKILLGTFGCVPAFDRYFTDSIKENAISSTTYSKKTICSLAEFYCKNQEKFEEKRLEINKRFNIEYPQMKLIDMCFWMEGYNRNSKITNKNNNV